MYHIQTYSKLSNPCCLRYLLRAASLFPFDLTNPDKTTVNGLALVSLVRPAYLLKKGIDTSLTLI